jgi:hypothetical protein
MFSDVAYYFVIEKEVSGFVAQARTKLTVPLKVRGTGSAVREKGTRIVRARCAEQVPY